MTDILTQKNITYNPLLAQKPTYCYYIYIKRTDNMNIKNRFSNTYIYLEQNERGEILK